MLSLDRWRAVIGYHPLHFWGLGHASKAPITSGCNDLVRQYAWQATDAVGRTEIQQAIDDAEAALHHYLGYSVGARPFEATLALDSANGIIALPNEGYLQSLGGMVSTTLGTAAVVLSDADDDGLLDTFTATVSTTLTSDPRDTIFVMVPESERIGHRTDWQILPVIVTTQFNGATWDVTITGAARTMIKPRYYEGITAEPFPMIDVTDLTRYLTMVQVVQRSYDATTAVTLTNGFGTYTTTVAARILDAELGIIQVGVRQMPDWSCSFPVSPQQPWTITVRGCAGVPRGSDGDLALSWQPIVARLAAAELAGVPCSCKGANHWLEYWQKDISRVNPNDEYAFKDQALNNPFGTRRGHIAAWNDVQQLRHARGIVV